MASPRIGPSTRKEDLNNVFAFCDEQPRLTTVTEVELVLSKGNEPSPDVPAERQHRIYCIDGVQRYCALCVSSSSGPPLDTALRVLSPGDIWVNATTPTVYIHTGTKWAIWCRYVDADRSHPFLPGYLLEFPYPRDVAGPWALRWSREETLPDFQRKLPRVKDGGPQIPHSGKNWHNLTSASVVEFIFQPSGVPWRKDPETLHRSDWGSITSSSSNPLPPAQSTAHPERSASASARLAARSPSFGGDDDYAPAASSTSVAPVSSMERSRERVRHWSRPVVLLVDGHSYISLRRILESKSAYFANRFATLFGPDDQSGEGEDYPVVEVPNVAFADFEILMDHLEGASFDRAPSFRELLSLLRAADTLAFTGLARFAKSELEEQLQDDVDQITRTRLGFGLQAIVLARKHGLRGILKRAFYEALRHKDALNDFVAAQNSRDAATALAPADVARLASAKTHLLDASTRAQTEPPRLLAKPCPHAHGDCTNVHAMFMTFWASTIVAHAGTHDPVAAWLDFTVGAHWARWALCAGCTASMCEFWAHKRRALWAQLDDWLDLEEDEDGQVEEAPAAVEGSSAGQRDLTTPPARSASSASHDRPASIDAAQPPCNSSATAPLPPTRTATSSPAPASSASAAVPGPPGATPSRLPASSAPPDGSGSRTTRREKGKRRADTLQENSGGTEMPDTDPSQTAKRARTVHLRYRNS